VGARKNQVASRDICFARTDVDHAPWDVHPETCRNQLSAKKIPDRGSFRVREPEDAFLTISFFLFHLLLT
jgi:hypothetical protein